jgi:putative serine protease PepD
LQPFSGLDETGASGSRADVPIELIIESNLPPPDIGAPFSDQPAPPAPARQLFGLPGRQVLLAIGLVMIVWFAGLVGALIGVQWAQQRAAPLRKPSTLGINVVKPRAGDLPRLDVEAIANDLAPSVVAVQSNLVRDGQNGESVGTGLIVTADGEIVTNAHVVGDAKTVHVRLNGESEPRDAAVVATDPARDLALLRVDTTGLSPAAFAAPDDVRLGDEVLAIGYALDLDGDPTVTLGIVSSLDRTLNTETGALKGLIQTDAAVSSGNSGGPLVNALGRVVGLTTLVSSTGLGSIANGLAFAISTGELLPEIDQLRAQANGQTSASGYLGVQLDRRTDGGSGALVTEVVAGSAAEKAGITVGDVVIAVDGEPITGQAGLIATIRNRAPGDTATVSLVRDGKPLDVSVVFGERPPA